MLESKLIAFAERLHSATLRVSLKMLNKRTIKADKAIAKKQAYAERVSEAALVAIAKAGAFYQDAQASYADTMREVNSLSNEIENRIDDLGFNKGDNND